VVELKYAVVERERRWLLPGRPPGLVGEVLAIGDRYLVGTRLRLREVTHEDGAVVRKLGHKVRLGDTAAEIACTSLYLDDAEWDALAGLPAHRLAKRRTCVSYEGVVVAVDEYDGHLAGLVIAEIDTRDGPEVELPADWDVVVEVTRDERYTGAALAEALGRP
jgi:CYTH domain-containing protein